MCVNKAGTPVSLAAVVLSKEANIVKPPAPPRAIVVEKATRGQKTLPKLPVVKAAKGKPGDPSEATSDGGLIDVKPSFYSVPACKL